MGVTFNGSAIGQGAVVSGSAAGATAITYEDGLLLEEAMGGATEGATAVVDGFELIDVASGGAMADTLARVRDYVNSAGVWLGDLLGEAGGLVATYGPAAFAIGGMAAIGAAPLLHIARSGIQETTPNFADLGLDEEGQKKAVQVYQAMSEIIKAVQTAGVDLSGRTVFVTTSVLHYDVVRGKLVGTLQALKNAGIRIGVYTTIPSERALEGVDKLPRAVQALLRGADGEILVRDGRYINAKVKQRLQGVKAEWWLKREDSGMASHVWIALKGGYSTGYPPPRILEPSEILLDIGGKSTYGNDEVVEKALGKASKKGHYVSLTSNIIEIGLSDREKANWRRALLDEPTVSESAEAATAPVVTAAEPARPSGLRAILGRWMRSIANAGRTGAAAVGVPAAQPVLKELTFSEVINQRRIGTPESDLILAMLNDVFYQTYPFTGVAAKDAKPLQRILARGVVGHTRTIFRTIENVRSWNDGYDMVRYEIAHPDGTVSIILAYKRATSPFDIGQGLQDLRPLFHSYFISNGDGTMTVAIYKDGQYADGGENTYDEGSGHAHNFVQGSIDAGGLFEIDPERIDQPIVPDMDRWISHVLSPLD